jgi:hypothetical protein
MKKAWSLIAVTLCMFAFSTTQISFAADLGEKEDTAPIEAKLELAKSPVTKEDTKTVNVAVMVRTKDGKVDMFTYSVRRFLGYTPIEKQRAQGAKLEIVPISQVRIESFDVPLLALDESGQEAYYIVKGAVESVKARFIKAPDQAPKVFLAAIKDETIPKDKQVEFKTDRLSVTN